MRPGPLFGDAGAPASFRTVVVQRRSGGGEHECDDPSHEGEDQDPAH